MEAETDTGRSSGLAAGFEDGAGAISWERSGLRSCKKRSKEQNSSLQSLEKEPALPTPWFYPSEAH